MTRVIVHPGFHKTGTTTVQKTLRQNRQALRPFLRIVLRPAMVAACEAARAYSASNDPLDLALFQYELAQLAEGWNQDDPRPVLMASEDLSGLIPGRNGLTSYAAAPQLMQVLGETLATVLASPQLVFFFSTRAAQPWLASCYAQNLRASRLTLTAAQYARQYRGSADLDAIIDKVAAAVAPCAVHRCALEDSQTRALGPLGPILDLVDIPAPLCKSLKAHPRANIAPAATLAAGLLQLNQSDLDDEALRAAKKALESGNPLPSRRMT